MQLCALGNSSSSNIDDQVGIGNSKDCRTCSSVNRIMIEEPQVGAPATATTSRRRGRPVIDGGSRGAVDGAATYLDVAEADSYAWECETYASECGACAENADSQARWGVNCGWHCK